MTHCINCGRVHKDREYPKRCGGLGGCNHIMFNNPIPIITLLQPVIRDLDVGLAVAQRADNEGWALFAGHVDPGESLEAAAVREFWEETGLVRQINEVKYRTSQHTITQVLTCFTLPPIDFEEWKTMRLCPENIDFGVMWARDTYPLIFPLHQILVDQWFRDQNV